MIKNSQRQREKREAAKWLQSLIGDDWGIRVLPAGANKPRPVHANHNARVEAVLSRSAWQKVPEIGGLDGMVDSSWESRATAEPKRASGIWLDRLSQRLIIRHFDGEPRHFRIGGEIITKPETVYFTGRRTRKDKTCLTLLMIDIDAHNRGDLQRAMQFAEHLREYFPGCYIEVSTNGNGAHIFLVIDKTRWADCDYNALLKEFDAWLKGVLAETGIELDTVEIKGHCATVVWKNGVPKHTAGTLAKLPRDWERFGELKSSPVYTAHELRALMAANPIKVDQAEAEVHAAKIHKMRQAGSIPCTGIDPERLDRWVEFGKNLLPAEVHIGKSANNRLVVTAEDVGIVCAMLEYIGRQMNKDGTLPWARTKGLWDCLYSRGVIRRSFNAKRFAWIRRFLNGAGLVDIQDATYIIGERAAVWSPSEKFWAVAASLDDKEGEEEQYLTETTIEGDWQTWWEKGIPLVFGGITTKEMAERRRIEELVEAIIGSGNSKMAA
jgi:hypothetical protein